MSAGELFTTTFAGPAQSQFSAPGRVNLIGEHTDYTGGLVLPFAIDARARAAAARTTTGTLRLVSAQRPGDLRVIALDELAPGAAGATGWAGYPAGAVWALREHGHDIGGLDLALDSQVPAGAGLSSSAAIECVTVLAASTLHDVALDPLTLARIAQRAENDFVGVPCGPMDQTASAAGREGSVLLFDTRSGQVRHVPFDPAGHGLRLLVIDTGVAHSLADGEYAARRASCELAARTLGVDQLRDLDEAGLPAAAARLPTEDLRHRVRHVVTENSRVERTVALLERGEVAAIGDLLTASHASLRDDYQVSCVELDVAVDASLAAGALGARMTGGGFGGSAIALVPEAAAGAVADRVRKEFESNGFGDPTIRDVLPAEGARRD
ncbi:MAG: galactokinase [Actinomycetales bacterium]